MRCKTDLLTPTVNQEDTALSMEMSSATLDLQNSFYVLQKLQSLEDQVFPSIARLGSTMSILTALQDIENRRGTCEKYAKTQTQTQSLPCSVRTYEILLQGHLESTMVIKNRIQGTSKLVWYMSIEISLCTNTKLQLATTVQFKSQAIARDTNDNMLRLAKDTVDDSATVRVVTLVTLIYLPASFIAVSLEIQLIDNC